MSRHAEFFLWMVVFASINASVLAEPTRLPAGRYIYLGADPNSGSPKAFSVTASGAIIWQDGAAATAPPDAGGPDLIFHGDSKIDPSSRATNSDAKPSHEAVATARQPALTPKMDPTAPKTPSPISQGTTNIESLDWPVIKFRPRPVPGTKDGFVQLTTTEEVNGSGYSTMGLVRYKLILLRATPTELTLELLDKDGFRLGNPCYVNASEFQPIADTDLVAARGQFNIALSDYSRVRDFSVAQRPSGFVRTRQTPAINSAFPYMP